ncbi:hypothetical protein BHE74_00026451 [Ensete ventricosum]|nr:hypothetical protein BHE74_00026451 [Ensete ventricosum]
MISQEVEKSFSFWGSSEGDSVHPAECMHQLLEQVRRHKVNIDGNVCTVMVTTLVLEVDILSIPRFSISMCTVRRSKRISVPGHPLPSGTSVMIGTKAYRSVPRHTDHYRSVPIGMPWRDSGTYRSARLSVRGPLATGRFRQKSTIGGRLKGEIGHRRSIEGEIDRRRSIEQEKGRKKKRKKKKKKKRGEKRPIARARSSPVRRRCPWVASAHAPSPPAGRQRPRTVVARGSRALFLPHEEKDRADVMTYVTMQVFGHLEPGTGVVAATPSIPLCCT